MRYIAIFADGSELAQRSETALTAGWLLRLRPADGGDIVLKGLAISPQQAWHSLEIGEHAYCARSWSGGRRCEIIAREVVTTFLEDLLPPRFSPDDIVSERPVETEIKRA
jgi:hypothetical protein